MKLLILTQVVDKNSATLGFFHRWVEEFAKHWEHVHVICLYEGEHTLPSNVSVHSLGKENGKGRFTYLTRFFTLIVKLRKEYDGVFVHMNPEYVILGGLLWRLWKKKIGLWYVHKSVTLSLRFAELFVRDVFTASKESFRLASRKVQVMGHGIDTDLFSLKKHVPSTNLRIITVGRVSESKQLKEMLVVLDVLHAKQIPFTFSVVGGPATSRDDSYSRMIEIEVRKRAYASQVTLVGEVRHADIPTHLERSDIFLHLSETGSLDKAVLEALSVGVPVVSTNPALTSILTPFGLFASSKKPSFLADILVEGSKVSREAVSEYVQREHALPSLIQRLTAVYAKTIS